MTKVRQHFPDNTLHDIPGACQMAFRNIEEMVTEGATIAVAVGSRGIDNIHTVVKETVSMIKSRGAKPFIVPAMGSHGGATPNGQIAVLESYDIKEKTIGAPINATMEVESIPGSTVDIPAFMDRYAYQADGVILINKIKPHTDFHAEYESGLVKMAVIGLGKERGAEAIHNFGVTGLMEIIPKAAELIFRTGKILAGIALVENAYDRTMHIEALSGMKIMHEEPRLLALARANRPSFPIGNIDVLHIDQMGKNISGVGIDTNIIGRMMIHGQTEPERPRIKSVIVTDLTDESHGNATGVGLADIITRNLFSKINFESTYKNIATSSFLSRGKIPFIAENDEEAMQLGLRNGGYPADGQERVIRIKDTLHLNEMYVSDAILDLVAKNANIQVIGSRVNVFKADGSMIPF